MRVQLYYLLLINFIGMLARICLLELLVFDWSANQWAVILATQRNGAVTYEMVVLFFVFIAFLMFVRTFTVLPVIFYRHLIDKSLQNNMRLKSFIVPVSIIL